MAGSVDIDAVRRDHPVSDVARALGIKIEPDGPEFKALCPFHNERSPSFTINDDKRFFHCFGCGAHGDVIDLVMRYRELDFRAAAEWLGGEGKTASEGPRRADREPTRATPAWVPVQAEESDVPAAGKSATYWNPKRASLVKWSPALVHVYRDDIGQILGCVLRIDTAPGYKLTPTVRLVTVPDGAKIEHGGRSLAAGARIWALIPFDRPRPLYGLESLGMSGPVWIFEGEKVADAGRRLGLGDTMAWPGGSNGHSYVDWSPLKGRDVILWGDADEPGEHCMLGFVDEHKRHHPGVADLVQGVGAASIWYVPWQKDRPKGWDLWDWEQEKPDGAAVKSWARSVARRWGVEPEPEPAEKPARDNVVKMQPQLRPDRQEEPDPDPDEQPEAVVMDMSGRRFPPGEEWRRDMIWKDNDTADPKVLKNQILTIAHDKRLASVFVFDEFAREIIVCAKPPWVNGHRPWVPRPLDDIDVTSAQGWLESQKLRPRFSDVAHAVAVAAHEHSVHPVREWFDALVWDGRPRLDTWLTYYLGVEAIEEHREYVRAVGSKWMIGAVARIFRPGCKMDSMLILEGPQDIGKSQALRVLATVAGREYFTDQVDVIGSKDAALQLQGVLVVELAENYAIGKAEINHVKAWVTRTVDRFRPPYGRSLVEAPRQCVLAGTINPEGGGYLRDPTGAKRFWPVKCTSADTAALEQDRDQIWAEAVARYKAGESWWADEELRPIMAAEQSERYEEDAWADNIDDIIAGRSQIRIEEIMETLKVPIERRDAVMQRRIARHLVSRKWERRKLRWGVLKEPKWAFVRIEGEA